MSPNEVNDKPIRHNSYQVAINAVIVKSNLAFRSVWNLPIFTTELRLGYSGDQTTRKPNPWEVGRAPRYIGRELDNSAGNSITSYIKVSRQIIKEFEQLASRCYGVLFVSP